MTPPIEPPENWRPPRDSFKGEAKVFDAPRIIKGRKAPVARAKTQENDLWAILRRLEDSVERIEKQRNDNRQLINGLRSEIVRSNKIIVSLLVNGTDEAVTKGVAMDYLSKTNHAYDRSKS